MEHDNKNLVDMSYSHKMSSLENFIKSGNTPDKNTLTFVDTKSQ